MDEPGGRQERPGAVLLATDLSSRCDRALDRAAQLAKDWGARLVVLHVVEQPDDAVQGAASGMAAAALDRVRRDLGEAGAALDVEVRVETGDPAARIGEVARATGAGLIVTGVARDEPFGRTAPGSTVLRLGRQSSVPVLVVRARPRPHAEVLVATDFSDSSRQALDTAAALFPDAALTLLHAYEVPFSGLIDRQMLETRLHGLEAEAFERFLEDMPAARRQRIRTVVEHQRPDRAIAAYMRDRGVDLVVIGSHGRSAVFERMLGSVAAQVLACAPGDVLLVRDRRAVAA